MTANAFSIVTEILKQRIGGAIQNSTLVHVGPLDDIEAKTARLVLFLYRVSVNGELRNAGHRIVPANPNDPIILHERALPFDLHYLISATTVGDDFSGLRDLGAAIQALNDTPDLVGGALLSNVVHLSFETMSTEELGRIWALFPAINYRTSVVLLATPVWVDPARSLPGAAPVTEETYRAHPVTAEAGHGY